MHLYIFATIMNSKIKTRKVSTNDRKHFSFRINSADSFFLYNNTFAKHLHDFYYQFVCIYYLEIIFLYTQ